MFKITMPIYEHSIVKSMNDAGEEVLKRRVIGIASGTELDRDEEEFALSAVKCMERAVQDGIITADGGHSLVPLQSDHKASWLTDLGFLTKAWIEEDDEQHNLWIEAELNESPSADYFFSLLNKENGPKLGLSIGGLVTKAHKKVDPLTKKSTLVFDHILLKEISVVSQPAYPTQYLSALTKSYRQKEEEEMKEAIIKATEETPVEEVAVDATKNEAPIEAVAEETTAPVVKAEGTDEENGEVVKSVSPEEFAEVQKALETANETLITVNKSITDLTEIINAMKAEYAHLSISFSANDDPMSAMKSVSDETVTTESIVQKELNTAFVYYTEKAIAPLVQLIRELRDEVEVLASTPVDKSLTVLSDEAVDKSPTALYQRQKSMAAEKGGSFDSIAAAVNSTFGLKG